jgi:hypothetical protein
MGVVGIVICAVGVGFDANISPLLSIERYFLIFFAYKSYVCRRIMQIDWRRSRARRTRSRDSGTISVSTVRIPADRVPEIRSLYTKKPSNFVAHELHRAFILLAHTLLAGFTVEARESVVRAERLYKLLLDQFTYSYIPLRFAVRDEQQSLGCCAQVIAIDMRN